MRIVHVSDCYPPRTGGIESQVRDLAAHQAAAGHEVHVLTATAAADGTRRGVEHSGGVRVHRMASALTFGLPVHPLGGRLANRALTRLRPDVVHVHAGVLSPFANDGARAARALGLPLAITWHCMLTGVEPVIRAGARLTGWLDAAAALSAVSAVAAERVAAAFGRDDVAVVTNGLDVARWRPPAADADDDLGPATAAGVLRVVATQRLAPRKRSVPLVEIFAAALEELERGRRREVSGAGMPSGPEAHLTIVGSGPDSAAVAREVSRRGLGDAVTLRGRLDRDRLPELYATQHAFLSATEKEAFGIAALEARAAGLAVVARGGTGISEFVVDGVDGLLGADDAALVAALVRLASDEALLAAILEHNRSVPPAADFTDVLAAAEREYARAAAMVTGRRR